MNSAEVFLHTKVPRLPEVLLHHAASPETAAFSCALHKEGRGREEAHFLMKALT
jgi:hypothetical protein